MEELQGSLCPRIGSGEIHLMQIKNQARAQRARCVIIDPVSALGKAGNEETAYSVAERLLDWSKAAGITLLHVFLHGMTSRSLF